MMETLTVDLDTRSYPIYIGRGLAAQVREGLAPYFGNKSNALLLTDERVAQALANWREALEFSVALTLPNGETTKSLEHYGKVLETLAAARIDRGGALVALGGGVIGDLGGFAAASYLRGIHFFQIPTTLLAMVDSSVGGKTGINLPAGKNLVGAFWQPKAVYIDVDVLHSLPRREFSAGMAEVIKYGLLYDADLLKQLRGLDEPLHPGHPELPGVIRRCCEIKAAIVQADEKETAASGGRALLNLGHTFAHAIENVAQYGRYLHGEAVAMGLMLASRLSERLAARGQAGFGVSAADTEVVQDLLNRYCLPTDLRQLVGGQEPPELAVSALLEAMSRDKKVSSGKWRFVAMETLGRAVTVEDVPRQWIHELWIEAGATS